MSNMVPPPLTPPECDLRDFPFMPLDIARLRRSKAWLKAKRNPPLAFYLINLWTASWHDVPAASLEDDDDVLADLAMCDPAKWAKVREEVLRGWVKCSDGRLYHATVAEKALEAWKAKLAQRARTEAARQAKELKRQQALSQNQSTASVTGSVTEVVTASKGEGQGQREGQGQGQGDSISVPDGTGGEPPKPAADPVKQEIWDAGRSLLLAARMPAKQVGSFLGKLVQDYTAPVVLDAVRAAVKEQPADPGEYLKACCMRAAGQRAPAGPINRQEALEQRGRQVAHEWANGASNAGS